MTAFKMPHWFIELQGEAFDTDEFTYWFPDGPDVFAVTEDKKCFLTGLAFLDCVDPSEVQETADRYIDELHSIILLLETGVKRPTVGTLFEVMPDGARKGHILLKTRISVRARLRANLQAEGKPANKTQARILLDAARSSKNLRVCSSGKAFALLLTTKSERVHVRLQVHFNLFHTSI